MPLLGEVMTGVKPKSAFLKPDLVIELTLEMAKQFVLQYIFRKKPLVPSDLGQSTIDTYAGKKQGNYA